MLGIDILFIFFDDFTANRVLKSEFEHFVLYEIPFFFFRTAGFSVFSYRFTTSFLCETLLLLLIFLIIFIYI